MAGTTHASQRKFDDSISRSAIIAFFKDEPAVSEEDIDEAIRALHLHFPDADPEIVTRLQAMTNMYAFDVRGLLEKRPKLFDVIAPIDADLLEKLEAFDRRTRQFLERAVEHDAKVYVDAE